MKHRNIKIDGFLSNFINCFWEHDNIQKEVEFTILPDGYFDLIFEIRNNEILNISLTGIWTNQINVRMKENTKLIGIQFKLIASEYIFKESIKQILNSETILPTDFWGAKNLPFDNLEKFADSLTKTIHYGLKNLKETPNASEVKYNNRYNALGFKWLCKRSAPHQVWCSWTG